MKLNRKGFTLIELLVTIVIVGLVAGLSTFGIIKIINNSEEQTVVLSEDNIKEAARLYSTESSNDSWKKKDNYDAFCVTIGELMNKGLLNKNAQINVGGDRNTFVMVRRNKVTLAIEKEEILTSNASICTGETINNENYTAPEITGSESYTDKIVINFTNGSADSGIKNYKCIYGDTSTNIDKEGIINGNACILNNLKNNKPYYVLIYMNSNNGSSIIANGNRDYITSDFKDAVISQNENVVSIIYNDVDTNDNNINNPSHYLMSSINGTTNTEVEKCTSNNGKLTCTGATTNIEKDTWYKVNYNDVNISYEEEGSVEVTARICDGGNNCKDTKEIITIENIIELVTYYVTATSGLNCRTEPNTSSNKIITYSCGTKILGYESSTSGWVYYPENNCYLSSTYLSTTKKSCSTGGSSSGSSSSSCPYGGTYIFIGGYQTYYCELERTQVASSSYAVGSLLNRYDDCIKYLNEIGKSGFSSSDTDSMYLGYCYYKAS